MSWSKLSSRRVKQPRVLARRSWIFTMLLLGLFGPSLQAGEERAWDRRRTPLVEAIAKAQPSVVNIASQKRAASNNRWPFSPDEMRGDRVSGMGTGVVLDQRGFILTNHHVVDGVDDIQVRTVDGETYTAVVLKSDPSHDLALIRIQPTRSLTPITIGTSADLMVGESVVTIGNAFGYENTVAVGIISWLNRNVTLADNQVYRNLIQTDAAINPGNSGGPLINIEGELIGINVAVRAGAQGIGFALPIDEVMNLVSRMMSTREIASTYHGVLTSRIKDLDESGTQPQMSLVVAGLEPGSPGEASGLQVGDRIVRVGKVQTQHPLDLERGLLDLHPGQTTSVEIVRQGEPTILNLGVVAFTPTQAITARVNGSRNPVTVGTSSDMRADPIWKMLGLDLQPVDSSKVAWLSTKLRGALYIRDVAPNSAAALAQLRPNDLLVGISDGSKHWETIIPENVLYILTHWENQGGPLHFYVARDGEVLLRTFTPNPVATGMTRR